MEVLVLDGKDYVKASKAARDLGYATDYVGQLCRSGQVDAHLIGRTWYVNMDKLSHHKVEKKRTSRVKAKEYAHKTIEAHRSKKLETQNNYNNIAIRYESDSEELIPEVKKLEIESEPVPESMSDFGDEGLNETVIENKGKHIVMSGDLTVVDVTDGPIDSETVVLKPGKITRAPIEKTSPNVRTLGVSEDDTEEVAVNDEPVSRVIEKKPDFIKRLINNDVIEPTATIQRGIEKETEQLITAQEEVSLEDLMPTPAGSIIPYVAVVVLLVALILGTLPLSQVIDYSRNNKSEAVTTYVFSTSDLNKIIQSKIWLSRLNNISFK